MGKSKTVFFFYLICCLLNVKLSYCSRHMSDVGFIESNHSSLEASQVTSGLEANVQIVARQALLDSITQEIISITQSKIRPISIGGVEFDYGSFNGSLTNMTVTLLEDRQLYSKLEITDGLYKITITNISVRADFHYEWSGFFFVPISGSGNGHAYVSLDRIDCSVYVIQAESTQHSPHIILNSDAVRVDSIYVDLHSFWSNFFYGLFVSLFGGLKDGVIGAVKDGIEDAILEVNNVLATLPTSFTIRELPFANVLNYSMYTRSYILLDGYESIGIKNEPGQLQKFSDCPYHVKSAPIHDSEIRADHHMISVYAHQSVFNCISWGLYRGKWLNYTIQNGTIPGVNLTTDVLGLIIPELPRKYPHQPIAIDISATRIPEFSFSNITGVTLSAYYEVSITLTNSTLNDPMVVSLSGNLNVSGQFFWDTSNFSKIEVEHKIKKAQVSVPVPLLDASVKQLIHQYGPNITLHNLCSFIPALKQAFNVISISRSNATMYDEWYSLSADVHVRSLPANLGEYKYASKEDNKYKYAVPLFGLGSE